MAYTWGFIPTAKGDDPPSFSRKMSDPTEGVECICSKWTTRWAPTPISRVKCSPHLDIYVGPLIGAPWLTWFLTIGKRGPPAVGPVLFRSYESAEWWIFVHVSWPELCVYLVYGGFQNYQTLKLRWLKNKTPSKKSGSWNLQKGI